MRLVLLCLVVTLVVETHRLMHRVVTLRRRHFKGITSSHHVMTRVTHMHRVEWIGIALHLISSHLCSWIAYHTHDLRGMAKTWVVNIWSHHLVLLWLLAVFGIWALLTQRMNMKHDLAPKLARKLFSHDLVELLMLLVF